MKNRGRFETISTADDGVAFIVGVKSDLLDSEERVILTVDVAYAATYDVHPGVELSKDDIELFATQGVLFQVHPYVREFIASACIRAGLPPALLPVLVRDDPAETAEA